MTKLRKRAAKRARKATREIHPSIKERLGYRTGQSDSDVMKDWRAGISRVCKTCWELKYCPYEPLVEQSPLLPAKRAGMVEHQEYKKKALETGLLGEIRNIDDDEKKELKRTLNDSELLIARAIYSVRDELRIEACAKADDPIAALHGKPLPPIQEYRVPYDIGANGEGSLDAVPKTLQSRVLARIRTDQARLRKTIETGVHDQTSPLDEARRAWF